MPVWWRFPGNDREGETQRKVKDREKTLNQVKEACQKFQVLGDQTVAHVLQEQEDPCVPGRPPIRAPDTPNDAVEKHLTANKLKAQQVRVNLRVARRLQEEEDERSRALDRKLREQISKDMDRDDKRMFEEKVELWEESRQRSHREQKDRARGSSGETDRPSEDSEEAKDLVAERRDKASPWYGIRYGQPRSRQPFVVRESEEGASWCEGESGREGGCRWLHSGLVAGRERAAIDSGLPRVIGRAATESPAPREYCVERTPSDSEDEWPLASTLEPGKRTRARPRVVEGTQQPARGDRRGARRLGPPVAGDSCLRERVDSPRAAPVSGHLVAPSPERFADARERRAFHISVSDSELRPRRRRPIRDPQGVQARAMSEVSHRPVRTRHSNRGFTQQNPPGTIHPEGVRHAPRGPAPHLSLAESPSDPLSRPGIERRDPDLHRPLEFKEKMGQDDGRRKHAHHPLDVNQKHTSHPLAVDQKHTRHLLGVDQKQARHPLAVDQNHIRHPLAVDQKHARHPLAVDQKHARHPLAVDQNHVRHPLAVDQKHARHPLAVDQKHARHPLAVDQNHVRHPLAVDQKHARHPLAVDQKHAHPLLVVNQKHIHWPLAVADGQIPQRLAPNRNQTQYPLTVDKNHAHRPLTMVEKRAPSLPHTKPKGKQVHFLLAPSERSSPTQGRLGSKKNQIPFPLDSKGKEVKSSLVGKQRRVHFPLAVGGKEEYLHHPSLVKENDVQYPLETKPVASPLALEQKPIQYQLDNKDTEAIIDYVLDKKKDRVSSSPKHSFGLPPAHQEILSGQSRGGPAETADKTRLLVSELAVRPACWRAEKDPGRSGSGRHRDGPSGHRDGSRWSERAPREAEGRPEAGDRTRVPRSSQRGQHQQRAQDTASRCRAARRRAGHDRPRSPDPGDPLPAESSREPASSKARGWSGLSTSSWFSDKSLKTLQALELRKAQLRKATANEKQLQLAQDEEFALDLLRQEMMAVRLAGVQKQSDLVRADKGFLAMRNTQSPGSDSPSSVNVDWDEEPKASKSAYF